MSPQQARPEGLGAGTLARAYADGTLSPVAVTEAVLDAARQAGDTFHAFACLNEADARRAAAESAARWQAGTPLSPFDGVPVTFKDSFNIAGLPRWHGSAVNEGRVSAHDAAPVRRVREAGLVIIGKTTMPDFGLLMSGLSSRAGVVRNPWNPDLNTAGSSAGAAAALACGAGALAIGTDMVGSVRLPAAVCGLTAFHATQGRVAYDPPGAYRGAGPMGRSTADVEGLLAIVGREDAADHVCLPGAFAPAPPPRHLHGLRIAVVRQLGWGTPTDAPTLSATGRAARLLAEAGAEIVPLADFDLAAGDYEAIYRTMVARGLAELMSAPADRRGRILPQIGAMIDEALCESALAVALTGKRVAAATQRLAAQLEPFDYVLSPALPVTGFAAVATGPEPDKGPLSHRTMSHMGFACWFNQLGRPAGTVPVLARPGTVPVSVQIAGRRFDDAGVLGLMALLEERRGFSVDFPLVSARLGAAERA
ncbi:amidase family protein [Pseudoxanthobacter sp.]|uniref:amidase family protein n=1 Tax=Pseudoxanthobacter sp. TaxID=1925742 RepID=UPI002FE3E4C3